MRNAIVLACDNSYMDKLETTIKSICAHNKNIKFYILNEDLPIEWFQLMTKRLSYFNSEILNILRSLIVRRRILNTKLTLDI